MKIRWGKRKKTIAEPGARQGGDAGAGLTPSWLAEAEALRARRPRGVLFVCLANAARSQMAEGIARSLAPPEVTVWSAGSFPAGVRSEAIEVLAEIGIDISEHRSKSVDEIPADRVDTVITLCAEGECPVFLGDVYRVHWELPDPTGVGRTEADRLDAFRRTRDELQRRLAVVFAHSGPESRHS